MKKMMVVGGGTMGTGIAQVFAQSGMEALIRVRKITDQPERLSKSLDKLVAKGRMDEAGKEDLLSRICYVEDLEAAADADLVLEAVVEDLEVKKSYFQQLDSICKPETILASNTSSISITAIATTTKRPDQFIGMHFFNPPTAMKLVEVIRGATTSDETFQTIYDLSKEIGKEPVEVAEAPGFVVNKILIPMINEAIDLVYTGVATPEDIDKAMQLGANHPMGPLHLGDLVGLDVCLAIMDTLYKETGDSKYRASLLLRKMVRSGDLGRKSGKGFFEYKKG